MAVKNPKNFEFKLGKQGLALFVAGMSLLLLMVFVFGVMVGVNIDAYPEKIARGLPDIIRRQLHRPPETLGPTVAVSEEEIIKAPPVAEQSVGEDSTAASLPEPFVSKGDLPPGAPGVQEKKAILASPPAGPRIVASTPQGPAAGGVEKTVAQPPADTAVGKNDSGYIQHPDYKADSARPANGEGKYSVQVASFKSRSKAKQFCDRITPLGFKPRVAMIELPHKGKWFRVTVDGFPSWEEAKKATVVLEKNIKGISGVIRPGKQ